MSDTTTAGGATGTGDGAEDRAAQLRAIEEEIRRQVVRERAENLAAVQQGRAVEAPPAPGQQQPWTVVVPPLAAGAPPPPRAVPAPTWNEAARRRRPSRLAALKQRGGLLGGVASVLLVVLKFIGPIFGFLLKFKFLATLGTALVSIVLEAYAYGWPMAIGFVSIILIHECGHSFATWRRGLPVKGIYIIPFMGGLAVGGSNGNPRDEAFIGIMGPVFGAGATFACLGLFALTRQPFFLVLAHISFGIHLANMVPVRPFDGSWVMGVFGKGAKQAAFRITAADRWLYGLWYAGMTLLFLTGAVVLANVR
jgi:Zn-dependent protease